MGAVSPMQGRSLPVVLLKFPHCRGIGEVSPWYGWSLSLVLEKFPTGTDEVSLLYWRNFPHALLGMWKVSSFKRENSSAGMGELSTGTREISPWYGRTLPWWRNPPLVWENSPLVLEIFVSYSPKLCSGWAITYMRVSRGENVLQGGSGRMPQVEEEGECPLGRKWENVIHGRIPSRGGGNVLLEQVQISLTKVKTMYIHILITTLWKEVSLLCSRTGSMYAISVGGLCIVQLSYVCHSALASSDLCSDTTRS